MGTLYARRGDYEVKGLTGISFLLCTNGLRKQASHVAGPLFSQSGQAVVG